MALEDKGIGKAKILIVDDLEMNRVILEEIIKDIGGEPLLASSGEEALEVVGKQSPELILTDISMPGMDGYRWEEKTTSQNPSSLKWFRQG